MMKYEFEKLAGYEVSTSDYIKIIEPMYMASNLDKAEFVKTISKKRFALKPIKSYIKEMKKLASQLKESCTHFTDYETKEKLDSLIREYIERKYQGISMSFQIWDEMIWSCYYPKTVNIFSSKTYQTFEIIELI